MRRMVRFAFLALILSLTLGLTGRGLLFASEAVEADPDPQDEDEWEMLSQRVSGDRPQGGNSGMMFIYNKRTGQAYRFFPNANRCPNKEPQGCFVAISGNHPPTE